MIKIKTQILAYEHAEKKTNKQKGCLITSNQQENMPLELKISFSHSYAENRSKKEDLANNT